MILVSHTASVYETLQLQQKHNFQENTVLLPFAHCCTYNLRASVVAFAANVRDLRVASQLFVALPPPLHKTHLVQYATSRSSASATALGPCATRAVLQSPTQNLCDCLRHVTVRRSVTIAFLQHRHVNTPAGLTMSSSLAAATQAAKRLQRQLDPAHEQPS
jgi:hypothetical protein